MTRISWWLVEVVSRALDSEERDAVRGDLAESGRTAIQALRDLIGLVIRREAELWKHWRPWLVFSGLVVPLGIFLSLISRRFANWGSGFIFHYVEKWDWRVLEMGTPAFLFKLAWLGGILIFFYAVLASWSWISGFVLGSVEGAIVRANGAVFLLVLLLGIPLGAQQYRFKLPLPESPFYGMLFPLSVHLLLVLFPCIAGMRGGLQCRSIPIQVRTLLYASAVVVTTGVVIAISTGVRPSNDRLWQVPPILLIHYLPVAYIIAQSRLTKRRKSQP